MNENPVVTIAIPTYNQEKYIRDAIASALSQNYASLEVVVCDDCSTDDTFNIACSIDDDRLKVFRTPRNLGRVANYKYILNNLAAGSWMCILDGDDYFVDFEFVSTAVNRLEKDPKLVMYVAGACSLNEQNGRISKAPIFLKQEITKLSGIQYVLGFYKYGSIGQHFAVIYNRKIALETNFYTLNSLGADTDSICRLALKGDVIIEKKWIGVWRSHSHNASYTLSIENVNKEVRMLRSIADAALKYGNSQDVEKWFRYNATRKIRYAWYSHIRFLPRKDALRMLIKRWSWRPQDLKEMVKIFIR